MPWVLRQTDKEWNVAWIYAASTTTFSLKIHHAGWFTTVPGRKYINGKVNYVDSVDGDEFSVLELKAMLKEIGYAKKIPMWYHFKEPDNNLDFGLHALATDDDVRNLISFIGKSHSKIIEVYIESWKTIVTPRVVVNKVPDWLREIDNALTQPYVPAKKMVSNVGTSFGIFIAFHSIRMQSW